MKGLSTLNNTQSKYRTTKLYSLDPYTHTKLYNQQQITPEPQYLSCAYHTGEKITNFCKARNCLLPLCPKCVKIHTEQHQRMGIFGNFETIDKCLEQCSSIQKRNVGDLSQIIHLSQKLLKYHQNQYKHSKQQLVTAKSQILTYVSKIFQLYQTQLDTLLIKQHKLYEKQLIQHHKQACMLLEQQKQLFNKSINKSVQMEFLIEFYSKPNLNLLLQDFSAKVQSLKPEYANITINTYELQRIKVIIKKYIDFGRQNQQIHHDIETNYRHKNILINSNEVDIDNNSSKSFSRSNFKSPVTKLYNNEDNLQEYGLTNKNQISKIISERLSRQSKLDNFQSPLESFSLERSRKARV